MKGKTIIELTDINTGEVKRIEDTNMFTNALDNIFNKAPYYFANPTLATLSDHNGQTRTPLTPVAGNALGGLLLFPEQIDEDEDTVYAPGDNAPTGIASFDAYSGDDARRGSLDEILTKPISNGYQFVWNFSATRANGTISCIGLTSKKGGIAYFDGGLNLYQGGVTAQMSAGDGYLKLPNAAGFLQLGADSTGMYFYNTSGLIKKYNIPLDKITLTSRFDSGISATELGTCSPNGFKVLKGDKIWCIRTSGNSSGNATVNIDKYDMSTWDKTTESITVSAPLRASANNFSTCVVGNYLYLPAYNNLDLYKINLTNVADVTKIENAYSTTTFNNKKSLIPFNGGVLCNLCLIDSEDNVHAHNLSDTLPMLVTGNWVINTAKDFYGELFVSATVLTPYLATINNVTPFTKLATQNMTVTYIVTES